MRWRDAILAGLVPIVAAAATALPALDRLDGLSIDSLFWLRHQIYGALHRPEQSPTVIIAIDEETYRRPPFEGLPKALWTPQLAGVIEATLEGGARVIGHDIILPTSVENHLPGYDRPYLVALRKGAKQDRIVLGKVQHLNKPISPFPGYSFAVEHQRNIRLVNLFRDEDGTIRRVPLRFRKVGPDGTVRVESSMALELAARATGVRPKAAANGGMTLGDYEIPGSAENAMVLNFDTGGRSIPVYSLADLHACAKAGKADFFRAQFGGKVVLIGSVLDVEDRKLTSQRYATGPEGTWFAERCVFPVARGLYDNEITRDSIPGSFIHAAAVNNLLRKDALSELSRPLGAALVLVIALVAAIATIALRPGPAVVALAGAVIGWAVVSIVLFREGLVLPVLDAPIAAALTFAVVLGYRFGIVDRDRRRIRHAFSHYLPPTIIDRMLESGRGPTLGGETRELTVWFSDLAGFTSLSEGMAPKDVVGLLNKYLNAMTEIIEAHGGFVETYVGDAIVAVFGAPLFTPDHARKAVEAAMACQQRAREIEPTLGLPPGYQLRVRIGINTGEMLIGNVGSRRHFSYAVMGDAVNQASRLEGANKVYGTEILASERTVKSSISDLVFREIDVVRLMGMTQPVRIYEPLGLTGEVAETQMAQTERFNQALSDFRDRKFQESAARFQELADGDPVARRFAQRSRSYAASPPPDDWDGVNTLDRK